MTVDDGVYIIDEVVGVVQVYDAAGELVSVLEPTADVIEIVTSELMGPQGPKGDQGVIGPVGPQGPVGPYAPTFEQYFVNPATVWTIVHNMDVYPVVDTFDLYGVQISGDVELPDRNTVVVTFDVPVAGFARLKA